MKNRLKIVSSFSAAKSIERYRQIEKDSGVGFYHEVGYLTISGQIQSASEKGIIHLFYTLFKIGLNGKMKIDKNTSNQKMDAIFNNQLFRVYNFVAWPKNIRSL